MSNDGENEEPTAAAAAAAPPSPGKDDKEKEDEPLLIHANVGFIGLGAMGLPMCRNVAAKLAPGYICRVYDVNVESMIAAANDFGAIPADSPLDIGENSDVVVTMVPNDAVLRRVVEDVEAGLLASLSPTSSSSSPGLLHIGCSTVHPDTSRAMAALHETSGASYVGAPVFARADGVARREASIVVGGASDDIDRAMPILRAMAMGVYRFGNDDAGAGNVVKLTGNFMIGAAIESCAEACSLAEKSGLDRVDVMEMLTGTIFDCLIYRGYGMRVAHRQHVPGQPLVGPGFQLDLGLKDVSLAKDVANKVEAPMPFCSVLQDRFLASKAKGLGKMDWSALALMASEEAGVDVSEWLHSPAEEDRGHKKRSPSKSGDEHAI